MRKNRNFDLSCPVGGGVNSARPLRNLSRFNYCAFSLAEMMVVMLIMSIVLAAMAPMITTRIKADQALKASGIGGSSDNNGPWKWVDGSDSDAYSEASRNMIGQTEAGSDDGDAMLIINTGDVSKDNILFKSKPTGSTADTPARLRIFGDYMLIGTTADKLSTEEMHSVSIGFNNATPYKIVSPWAAPAYSKNAIAVGQENIATGNNAVAMGYGNTAGSKDKDFGTYSNQPNALAVGTLNNALSNSSAIGYKNNTRANSVALGNQNTAGAFDTYNYTWGTAVGIQNTASRTEAVALGFKNTASANRATAVGWNNTASGYVAKSQGVTEAGSLAAGFNNSATAPGAVALGVNNTTSGQNSLSLGCFNKATESGGSIAIGGSNTAAGGQAFGYHNSAPGYGSIAIGTYNKAESSGTIALGWDNTVNGGNPSVSESNNSMAIGYMNKVPTYGSYVIGKENEVEGNYGVVMGVKNVIKNSSSDISYQSIAIGNQNRVWSQCSTALGFGNYTGGKNSVAIGYDARTSGVFDVAIGGTVCIKDSTEGSVAIGDRTYVNASHAVAIGFTATANNEWDFVLGSSSHNVRIPGKLYVNGANVTSDKRLKYIKGENKNGLDKIRQIKVYNFTFKKDKDKEPRVGVIAQELQKILPDAVKKGSDGFLTIRIDDIIYTLVNAVKELDKKVSELTETLKQVQAEQKRINQRLDALEHKSVH